MITSQQMEITFLEKRASNSGRHCRAPAAAWAHQPAQRGAKQVHERKPQGQSKGGLGLGTSSAPRFTCFSRKDSAAVSGLGLPTVGRSPSLGALGMRGRGDREPPEGRQNPVSRWHLWLGEWAWGWAHARLLTASTSSLFSPSSLSLARISSRCLSTTSFNFFITCRSRSDMPGGQHVRPAGESPSFPV